MNLRFARPVGWCPRSYLKCLLVPSRQWWFRQSRHMPGQLRPMTCRAPQPRSILHGGQPPMLPMLIPLPTIRQQEFCASWDNTWRRLTRCRREVMRLALGPELFPSEVVNVVAPLPRVHRTATQMSAMGLWRPPVGPGVPGSMPVSSFNNCTGCSDCSPEKSG